MTYKKSLPLVAIAITSFLLYGCDGGACTTDVRTSVVLTLTDSSLNDIEQCRAQVTAVIDGSTITLPHHTSLDSQSCRFDIAQELPGTYNIEAKVQGFETVNVDGIEVSRDSCHVITRTVSADLIPAASNCHEGYSWINERCETLNGCAFPLFERAVLSGIEPDDGSSGINYECLDVCKDFTDANNALPERPGYCQSLALP